MSSGIGWLRIAVGVALGAAPRSFLRATTDGEPPGALILFTRTVGIRDLALGAGTIAALQAGSPGDVRRWIAAGLTSDALDLVASLASARLVGTRGALIATGVTLPVVAADIWALTHLDRPAVSAPTGA
jgi:hypothetical protein